VLAIVPVNAPGEAKRRLAPFLTEEQLTALVLAMLADVLDACRQAASIDRTLIVSPDTSLAPPGVEVLRDPGRGHAAAIELALAAANEDGAVILMADCPLVTAEALDRLVGRAQPIAVGPAQDGGTNALAMRPASLLIPAFGVRNGAAVIVERARAAGLEPAVIDDPGLALDVDTLEDIERVRELGEGTHTRRVLLGLDDVLRLS
jgi:2-phospho-L-lactate guanylyltransferase